MALRAWTAISIVTAGFSSGVRAEEGVDPPALLTAALCRSAAAEVPATFRDTCDILDAVCPGQMPTSLQCLVHQKFVPLNDALVTRGLLEGQLAHEVPEPTAPSCNPDDGSFEDRLSCKAVHAQFNIDAVIEAGNVTLPKAAAFWCEAAKPGGPLATACAGARRPASPAAVTLQRGILHGDPEAMREVLGQTGVTAVPSSTSTVDEPITIEDLGFAMIGVAAAAAIVTVAWVLLTPSKETNVIVAFPTP